MRYVIKRDFHSILHIIDYGNHTLLGEYPWSAYNTFVFSCWSKHRWHAGLITTELLYGMCIRAYICMLLYISFRLLKYWNYVANYINVCLYSRHSLAGVMNSPTSWINLKNSSLPPKLQFFFQRYMKRLLENFNKNVLKRFFCLYI